MENETYNKLVNQLFTSAKWEKRAEAAREIGHLGEAKATNLLFRALKSEKDAVVTNSIIEAMGRIKDPKATMPIIDFLKAELEKDDPDKNRLFVIVESLMKIGDKRALTHLGLLYNSCEADIKNITEEALECIDPNWKENIKNQ
jgi:HEAT repeat protein